MKTRRLTALLVTLAAGLCLVVPTAQAAQPTTNYSIKLRTSDIWGAGTDCGVSIRLSGWAQKYPWESSVGRQLDTKFHNDFERGNTDTYSLNNVPQIGTVVKVMLTMGGWGPGLCGGWKSWHPSWVEVTDTKTDKTWKFPFNMWITDCEVWQLSATTTKAECGNMIIPGV